MDKNKLELKNERDAKAKEFWAQVATDVNAGMTAKQIANRYKNPVTGKPYTREHIYWVIKQLNKTRI
jgi:hypothetical protein